MIIDDYASEVIRGYDAVADIYDEFYTEPSDLAEDDVIFGRLRRLAWRRQVVDIGCGPGTVLSQRVCEPEKYLGIDPSWGMIDQARKTHPEARFIHGEMASSPESRAEMLIGTFGPLCHIEDVTSFAMHARRACAPGARLFVMSSRWPEIARITGTPMVGHTPDELHRAFSLAGFAYVRVRGFIWKHGPMRGPRWMLRMARAIELDYLGSRRPDEFKWLITEGVAVS